MKRLKQIEKRKLLNWVSRLIIVISVSYVILLQHKSIQQLSEQVSREELELTQSYIVKTNDYMQEIGKTLGYDYVMSYRVGGAMLYANERHDITTKIIKLLNERYESSK